MKCGQAIKDFFLSFYPILNIQTLASQILKCGMESIVCKVTWKSSQLENLGVDNPLIMTVAMGHFYKNEALAGIWRKNTNMLVLVSSH